MYNVCTLCLLAEDDNDSRGGEGIRQDWQRTIYLPTSLTDSATYSRYIVSYPHPSLLGADERCVCAGGYLIVGIVVGKNSMIYSLYVQYI